MKFTFEKTLDSLNSVPAALRGVYTEAEDGDGFELTDEASELAGLTVGDPGGLRSSLEKERENVREAESRIRDLKRQLRDAKEKSGGKPDPEEVATLKAKLEKAQEGLDRWKKTAVETKVDHEIRSGILSDHAENPVELLLPVVRQHVGHEVKEDGTIEVFVKADGGGRRLSSVGDNPGDMGVSELVGSVLRKRDDLKRVFPAKQDGGSGAGGSDGDGGKDEGPNPWKEDSFNMTAQALIEKESPAKAKRLKAAAGVRD